MKWALITNRKEKEKGKDDMDTSLMENDKERQENARMDTGKRKIMEQESWYGGALVTGTPWYAGDWNYGGGK